MESSLGTALYNFLDSMFSSIIFQGIFITALIALITSAWGMFLPLNKPKKDKQKATYPFIVSYGVICISSVFFLAMKHEGFNPIYHTGIILTIVISVIVTLAKYLPKLLSKQKTLDSYLN
ncbi:MAG TPA: hypothetical protein VJ571_01670 [Candidatus Nitrosotalea sp.]|nr:hypothetical protein [Candidatus Nitrosotalea sp.]